MKKVVTIIGARPQFIKAATVSKVLALESGIEELLLHTGQHFDTNMSEVFFEELQIPAPAFHLNIGGGSHGQNTGRMIEKIEEVLINEKPDIVLVYGDTDSTLAGAIAASKLQVPLAHVEAGLRSFNRQMPEEINRILTDHAADILFTPSRAATKQLISEGIEKEKIIFSGDVMYDAVLMYGNIAFKRSNRILENLSEYPFILLTLHRAENVDNQNKLSNILESLNRLKHKFIFPVHPRTAKRIQEFKIKVPSNLSLIDPVGYIDMLYLQRKSYLIMTDSGGIQKEAFFNKVPCITLRTETEWRELVEIGVNIVIANDLMRINEIIDSAMNVPSETFENKLYGNGDAAKVIVNEINNFFNK